MIVPKNDVKIEEADHLDQWEEPVEAVESEAVLSWILLTNKKRKTSNTRRRFYPDISLDKLGKLQEDFAALISMYLLT